MAIKINPSTIEYINTLSEPNMAMFWLLGQGYTREEVSAYLASPQSKFSPDFNAAPPEGEGGGGLGAGLGSVLGTAGGASQVWSLGKSFKGAAKLPSDIVKAQQGVSDASAKVLDATKKLKALPADGSGEWINLKPGESMKASDFVYSKAQLQDDLLQAKGGLSDAAENLKWTQDSQPINQPTSLFGKVKGGIAKPFQKIKTGIAKMVPDKIKGAFHKISTWLNNPLVSAPLAAASAWGLYVGIGDMVENGATALGVASASITTTSLIIALHKLLLWAHIGGPVGWAIAAGVVITLVVMSIFKHLGGSKQADITPTGNAVQAFLDEFPTWWKTLPSASIALMSTGVMLGGMSYNLTPGSLYQTFSVPTVQLTAALQTASGKALTTPDGQIFIQEGKGPNGSDQVLITNSKNGKSTGFMFNLDKRGYVIGKNGPADNYLPFFQPITDSKGNLTGYKTNPGALNAILQVPACAEYANDVNMDPQKREAALASCLRANKNVTFVPIPD